MGNLTAVGPTEHAGSRADEPREDRRYSWVEGYLARLEGKESREEYYARLEYEGDRTQEG